VNGCECHNGRIQKIDSGDGENIICMCVRLDGRLDTKRMKKKFCTLPGFAASQSFLQILLC